MPKKLVSSSALYQTVGGAKEIAYVTAHELFEASRFEASLCEAALTLFETW